MTSFRSCPALKRYGVKERIVGFFIFHIVDENVGGQFSLPVENPLRHSGSDDRSTMEAE